MIKTRNLKRSLVFSIVSLLTCLVMLIGATFAWFTDSVSTGKNTITAGNLDVELYYKDADGSYKPVEQNTAVFDDNAWWEPGYTQIAYLKVKNTGTLALKYQFAVNVKAQTAGTNVDGQAFNLSDYLVFGAAQADSEITYTTREQAWAAAGSTVGLNSYQSSASLAPKQEQFVALVLYMPTDVGNAANYKTGTTAPSIDLGINLIATQDTVESDSFDDQYDAGATYPLISSSAAVDAFGDDTVTNIEIADDLVIDNETDRMVISGDKVIDFAGNTLFRDENTGTGLIIGEKGHYPYPVNVTIKNANFESESISAAVRVESGSTVKFYDCTFDCTKGEVIQAVSRPGEKTILVFENCTFNGQVNLDTLSGGGTEYDVTFIDCEFTGEFGNGGAAVAIDSNAYGSVILENCNISAIANGNAVNGIDISSYKGSNGENPITVTLKNTNITLASGKKAPSDPVAINSKEITTLNIQGGTFTVDGVEKVFDTETKTWDNK